MSQTIIQLPLIPISLNKLYRQFRGRTIISKEGREFKSTINAYLKDCGLIIEEDDFIKVKGLSVEINFFSNKFYTKSGEIRKRYLDADNLLKVVLDVVFKELGIDDSFISRLVVTKSPGIYDLTEIKIERNVY
jgi:Holliday junction resolvase RusA-like endonuclease